MSDRVAVMRDGCIEQLGTSVEIYDQPETEFVARFIGLCNVIQAEVVACTKTEISCMADGLAPLTLTPPASHTLKKGDRISVALRPEEIQVRNEGKVPSHNGLRLRVEDVTFVGSTFKIKGVSSSGQALDIDIGRRELGGSILEPGQKITVEWDKSAASVLRRSPSDEGSH